MKYALPSLLGVMAFSALLLGLSALEKDDYENGSRVPPPPGNNVPPDDAVLHKILPDTIEHPCPICETCRHSLTVVENRRELSVPDHDGWYKLFWAADERYYFDDPVYLVQALSNRSAGAVQGTWRLRAIAGPAIHPKGAAHACPAFVRGIELDYALHVSEDPPESKFFPAPLIGRVFDPVPWITYHRERPVSLSWRLTFKRAENSGDPCTCSTP